MQPRPRAFLSAAPSLCREEARCHHRSLPCGLIKKETWPRGSPAGRGDGRRVSLQVYNKKGLMALTLLHIRSELLLPELCRHVFWGPLCLGVAWGEVEGRFSKPQKSQPWPSPHRQEVVPLFPSCLSCFPRVTCTATGVGSTLPLWVPSPSCLEASPSDIIVHELPLSRLPGPASLTSSFTSSLTPSLTSSSSYALLPPQCVWRGWA